MTSDPSIERIERAMRGFKRVADAQRVQRHLIEVTGVDMDASSFRLLMRLGEAGPARLSDLAAQMWLDLSVISRRIKQLEEHGFVERTPDPDDARAARVQLSAAGAEITKRIKRGRHASLRSIFATWSAQDKDKLGELLERFMGDIVASYETSKDTHAHE